VSHTVIFTPEAQSQILNLHRDIALAASVEIAARYTGAILAYCENLKMFPMRGTARNDIRPGLRVTNHRKRTIIAFKVDADVVSIIGIFHGGQNYETALDDVRNDEN
jgi:toxin ParE1/3/4